MNRWTVAVLTTGAILFSCEQLLETKELIQANPTEHIFDVPVADLRQVILASFNSNKQSNSQFYQSSVFYFNAEVESRLVMPVTFMAETADHPFQLFSKKHFEIPNTQNDIYLYSHEYWHSPIYHIVNRPVLYRAFFILTLEELDQQKTLLRIRTETQNVIVGPSGDGNGLNEVDVPPTTIEEYSLILFIAEQLGDSTLTPLSIKTRD